MFLQNVILRPKKFIGLLSNTRHYSILEKFVPGIVRDDIDEDEEKLKKRKLKDWGKPKAPSDHGLLRIFDRSPPREEFPLYVARGSLPNPDYFGSWLENKIKERCDEDQAFLPERHRVLGNDLASAHFSVRRGGKIRTSGSDKFLSEDDYFDLPSSYDPHFRIEEIFFCDEEISYKGLENYRGLVDLKRMTFRNCKYYDDWCLEKTIAVCPTLEYLNVEECQISERGLESLYKAVNLKEFIVTDFNRNPSFELTCLLIEDCMPNLKITKVDTSKDNIDEDKI